VSSRTIETADHNPARSIFGRKVLLQAVGESFVKLDPRHVVRSPVMFVVEMAAVLITGLWIAQAIGASGAGIGADPVWFSATVAILLWLTVVFANLAEAIAEGRGKAQAATLREMRTTTCATLKSGQSVPAANLNRGDVVVVQAGETIPGDGTIIEGIASVDESAITGESAPVIREAGGDRSAVTGGTKVL